MTLMERVFVVVVVIIFIVIVKFSGSSYPKLSSKDYIIEIKRGR
jgi:hypothetical protein